MNSLFFMAGMNTFIIFYIYNFFFARNHNLVTLLVRRIKNYASVKKGCYFYSVSMNMTFWSFYYSVLVIDSLSDSYTPLIYKHRCRLTPDNDFINRRPYMSIQ